MAELSRDLSEAEFRDWLLYFEAEPWGEPGAYYRNGIVAAILANANRDPKRGNPLTPADFMPKPRQRGGVDGRKLRADLETAFAGRIKRRPKDG